MKNRVYISQLIGLEDWKKEHKRAEASSPIISRKVSFLAQDRELNRVCMLSEVDKLRFKLWVTYLLVK